MIDDNFDDFVDLGYLRDIEWVDAVSRDALSTKAQKSLGGQLTHFRLSSEVSEEIRRLCG